MTDEEVNLVVFDDEVAAKLDADFDADLRFSERIRPARWRRRSLGQRVFERAMSVARPWM